MMDLNDSFFAILDNITINTDMGVCDKEALSASNSNSISTNSKSTHTLSMLVQTLCGSGMMPVKVTSRCSNMVTNEHSWTPVPSKITIWQTDTAIESFWILAWHANQCKFPFSCSTYLTNNTIVQLLGQYDPDETRHEAPEEIKAN